MYTWIILIPILIFSHSSFDYSPHKIDQLPYSLFPDKVNGIETLMRWIYSHRYSVSI